MNAFSTNDSLASAPTTCLNDDRSAYFWPVLRVLEAPATIPDDHAQAYEAGPSNRGARLAPTSVTVRYLGNPTSKVVAMPPFLRLVTGDAHAVSSPAPRATLAQWSCTGVPNRTTAMYPRCPPGQQVLRTYDFPSCWDGRHVDSTSHRTHVVFPADDGTCPPETFPIPHLQMQTTYKVPPGPSYAIDTFPEEHRSPITDHADFINVMPEPLMARAVHYINTGQQGGP